MRGAATLTFVPVMSFYSLYYPRFIKSPNVTERYRAIKFLRAFMPTR